MRTRVRMRHAMGRAAGGRRRGAPRDARVERPGPQRADAGDLVQPERVARSDAAALEDEAEIFLEQYSRKLSEYQYSEWRERDLF